MMSRQRNNCIILFLTILFCFTGCYDYKDINDRLVILGIGIDGNEDEVLLTSEGFSSTKYETKSDIQSKLVKTNTHYGKGKSFEKAIDKSSFAAIPFLGVARAVVIGKQYASRDIESFLNYINADIQFRKTLPLVISRESASEIMSMRSDIVVSPSFIIEKTLEQTSSSGKGLPIFLGKVMSDIAFGNIGYVIPYIGIERDDIQYLGLAVMKDFRMIGVIPEEDSWGLIYLKAKNALVTIEIPHPSDDKDILTFDTNVKKRKIKTDYVNKKVILNIDLDIDAKLTYEYKTQPIEDEVLKEVENKISDKIKKYITELISKSRNEYKTDFFGFARFFKAENYKIYNMIDWEAAYENAEINVMINTDITNLGIIEPNAKKEG